MRNLGVVLVLLSGIMRTAFLLLLMLVSLLVEAQKTPQDVLSNMVAGIEASHSYEFTLASYEMLDGNMQYMKGFVRQQNSPFSIYMHVLQGDDSDVELLYKEGEMNGKVLVNPKMFLVGSVKLDPMSKKLREGKHYPIPASGFEITKQIANSVLAKPTKYTLKYLGETRFDEQKCDMITIQPNNYSTTSYTVKEGESSYSISRNLMVSEYVLLKLNPELSCCKTPDAGSQIKVPTAYCKEIILYVSQESGLPIYQELYDANGLMSQYEFYDMKVNPDFNSSTFSRDNTDYDL